MNPTQTVEKLRVDYYSHMRILAAIRGMALDPKKDGGTIDGVKISWADARAVTWLTMRISPQWRMKLCQLPPDKMGAAARECIGLLALRKNDKQITLLV